MNELIPSLLTSTMVMALAMVALAFGTSRRRRPGARPEGHAETDSRGDPARAVPDPACGLCAGPCDAEPPVPTDGWARLHGRRGP
jgi:hypothetical protein